jgi:hypothetical protein
MATRWRSLLPLCWALSFSAAFQPQMQASAIVDLDHWLQNTNSDGSVSLDGSTLVLTGPNNGSGLSGSSDFLINPTESGVVQFHYYYSTYDHTVDAYDDPGYDFAGFLLGDTFLRYTDIIEPLANRVPFVNPITGALLGPGIVGTDCADLYFGDVQMPVTLGQLFGFRVGSQDNLFLPGTLTISDFSFTPANPTPEPGSWPLMLVAVGVAFVARRRIVRRSQRTMENA